MKPEQLTTKSNKTFVGLFILLVKSVLSENQCGGEHYSKESLSVSRSAYAKVYTCPVIGGDEKKAECCDPPTFRCCQSGSGMIDFESRLGIITVIGSACALIASIATLMACCFSEKCPLYLVCRREAKLDYIATREEAEVLHMPGENFSELTTYNPTAPILLSKA